MPAAREIAAAAPEVPGGRRLNLPYLMGVYLVVNSVRDLWLVVDGPDCSHFKGQFIHGKHDWYSTLFRVDGRHRIMFTGTNAQNIAPNRDEWIAAVLGRAASVAEAGAVLLTSMPLCGITGVQYDRVIAELGAVKPVVEVPGLSLRGDWLDGYSAGLAAIARHKALPKAKPRRGTVAVVGYFMDRNEGDHAGNLVEMKRLLGALGLNLVSVWPGGGTWRDLDRVAQAGTILSFPHGREAARVLAGKTGARLFETEIPLGIEGTRQWVETIGACFGREARARKLVETELDRIVPRFERAVPFYFLNRGAALVCDPHHLAGLAGLCADLGMRVRFAAAMAREGHAPDLLEKGPSGGPRVQFEVTEGRSFHRLLRKAGLLPGDLVICSGEHGQGLQHHFSVLEFGVPSYTHHVFADVPFLGFTGALHLIDRMANALSAARD
ncbi:MAG: hypothetical protein HY897_10955 [Deltaproteobacteria bacterium]|nr:hypothetical protein [Deltaproteobacteria bacterium]